jgi:hypothetical protein
VWSNTGEDTGVYAKGLNDIGWKVPGVAALAATVFAQQAVQVGGPETFDRLYAINLKSFTYCESDPVGSGPVPKLAASLKQFDPQNYDKLGLSGVALTYDSLFILKAAVEATHSLDGEVLTKWIEANPIKTNFLGTLVATPTNHFIVKADGLAVVEHPETSRSDGLMKRAGGC